MNTRYKLLKPALAALLALMANQGHAIDLMASYQRALEADPSLLAANEAVLAGREKAVQAASLFKPQVGLTASVTQVDSHSSAGLPAPLPDLSKPDSKGALHQLSLQLKQPLYNAQSKAEQQQLLQQTELAEIQHRQARQDLMQRVSEAYFGVLLAQESLRVVQNETTAVRQQRDRAQARFELGRGKITEVQETQARLDQVLTREVSAQSTLALRRAQYQELTGQAANGLAELAGGFTPQAPAPESLDDWQQRGLAQSAHVLSKRSELAIAGAETRKYALASRPTLDLVASLSDRGQHGGLASSVAPDTNRSASLGLQLNVPLYTGGGLNSREREALAKERQVGQELQAAQRDTRLKVQDAWLSVRTGAARIVALEQQQRSAMTALEATTLGRDVGNRTELDVLDAQQRLFTAQLDLAQARCDYLLGRVRLSAAAGDLQESELRALNTYLAS